MTLVQTGKACRRCPIVLFGRAFWQGLINLDRMAEAGFIRPEDLKLFCYADSPEDAYQRIVEGAGESWTPKAVGKVQT
jgi:predicted Rossmann-fold nucleotide-binding protein